jgi:hypothetical protein
MDRTTAQTAVTWAHICSVPKKEVVRIRWHREVISEWSQGAGHSNGLGKAQAVDRTCGLTTQWQSGDLHRSHLVSDYSPTKLPSQLHSLIKIRQPDYYEIYCTQWNLEFTFPDSTFSLILCIFLLVLPQLPQQHCIFLRHILVLRSKLLNYIIKVLFIHQLMHQWVVLKNSIKICIEAAPTCFDAVAPSSERTLICAY